MINHDFHVGQTVEVDMFVSKLTLLGGIYKYWQGRKVKILEIRPNIVIVDCPSYWNNVYWHKPHACLDIRHIKPYMFNEQLMLFEL